MAQIQQKSQEFQANQQFEQQKFAAELAFKDREFQAAPMLEAMKREFEAKLEGEKMQREDQAKQFSEMMATQRNEADNRQKQMTELLKNRDDNITALQVAQMKLQNSPPPESSLLQKIIEKLGLSGNDAGGAQ